MPDKLDLFLSKSLQLNSSMSHACLSPNHSLTLNGKKEQPLRLPIWNRKAESHWPLPVSFR